MFVGLVDEGFFLVFLDEGEAAFGVKKGLKDRPIPNGVFLSVSYLFKKIVDLLERRHANNVSQWSKMSLILINRVYGKILD